ncbi:alpha/beta fold hydrolase [Polymorphobacter sp.]|uniref:alpha/beta fold hydrolase n=1 Tax=Polymorphobacter sp. TaxID=1909290 RepID=UPI003F71BE94
MTNSPDTCFLDIDGARLAFRHTPGDGPLLVFLPGYMSDMTGTKATTLFDWAVARGQACLLLDYSGCGASGGAFLAGTISRWTRDALAVIDHVAPGQPVLPIGSSMGGWVALRLGLALQSRLAGLVGIAAAPDFPDWGLSISDAEAADLATQGWFSRPSGYAEGEYLYSKAFLDDAVTSRMLASPIALTAPVRLIHGQADDVVPFQVSLDIAARLTSPDVQVTLIKNGDHRLSRDADLALLLAQIESLIR